MQAQIKWHQLELLYVVPTTQEPFCSSESFLPSWFPENTWVVFLGTVCPVTGCKQQGFLGSESVLPEDCWKRKTEKEFVSSLVTKVTFCEEKSSVNCTQSLSPLFMFPLVSHIWGDHTHPGGLLPIKWHPVHMAAATVIEACNFKSKWAFIGCLAFPNWSNDGH